MKRYSRMAGDWSKLWRRLSFTRKDYKEFENMLMIGHTSVKGSAYTRRDAKLEVNKQRMFHRKSFHK